MRLIIVGNGISGITVATEVRKKDKNVEIIVISSESQYFYSRPALMYIYMRDMTLENTQPYEKYFWQENNIQLIYEHVYKYIFDSNTIVLENGEKLEYDKLVLAVGAVGNKFGWPGEDLENVFTFTNLNDLHKLEKTTENYNDANRVAIVGGGLIGIEVAEMMHHRNIPCSFLVREDTYWSKALSPQEGKIVQEEIIEHEIDLQMQTELLEIKGNESNIVSSIINSKKEEIKCDTVILTAGVIPNIAQFQGTPLATKRGILVNEKMQTNIDNVYAVGDCAEIFYNNKKSKTNIELLWYTGKMHGKIAAQNILGNETVYNRGIWYNSAKFFGIDYHTYGSVNMNIPQEINYFYQIPQQKRSLRIICDKNNIVIGFNFLGFRFRHKICEQWIKEEKTFEEVIKNLSKANFDSEFNTFFKKQEDLKECLTAV